MIPATYDITLKQGSDWELNVYVENDNGTPKDLTDYSCYMHMRPRVQSAEYVELTSEGASPEITITPSTGKVQCVLPYTETVNIGWLSGAYDLHLHKSGTPDVHVCILEGKLVVKPLVTRGVEWEP